MDKRERAGLYIERARTDMEAFFIQEQRYIMVMRKAGIFILAVIGALFIALAVWGALILIITCPF